MKAQKINEEEELKEQAGMFEIDGNAILGNLEKEIPSEEVTQEEKDKNPIQFKYEVSLTKMPRKFKSVLGLKTGKIGRVINVLDSKTVMVDFWDTKPARIPVKNTYLKVEKTRKEVEIEAGTYVEKVEKTKTNNIPLKYDAGKPRLDLIRPEFTLALGEALGYGANKYNEKVGDTPNYLKGGGFNYSKIIGSLERHIQYWKMGENIDEESKLHHLSLAAANLMFLLTYELKSKGIDDRTKL